MSDSGPDTEAAPSTHPPVAAAAVATARALLSEHPLVDGHNDLPWALRKKVNYDFDRCDIAVAQPELHTDIPRLRAGGVGAQFWSVYVPGTLTGDAAVTATLEQIDAVHRMIARYPETFGLARTADELERVFGSGRIASLLGMEGGHSINDSLGVLRAMYALGVRYLTLTHNQNVSWADAATDDPRLGGLSDFGEQVVAEMNRLGMLVDLSHTSPDTMRAALRVSRASVIFSHSSARAVCDVPRNVPDDVLAALGAGGGVCMVTFVPEFVSPACAGWRDDAADAGRAAGIDPTDLTAFFSFRKQWAVDHPKPVAQLADVVAHVEHVREVAGIDHIGLGGDYDGTDGFPAGMADVASYPRLVAALLDRGWSTDELAKLAGANVIRALRDAEAVAAGN